MTMYFGGNRVNRSVNGGISWSAISDDLSKNEPQMDPHSGYRIRGVITTIAAAASAPDTVWAGTDDGFLWKTEDAGAHVLKTSDGGKAWENISGDLPAAPVSDVLPIGDRLFIASDVGVFVTENQKEWHRLGANLPAVPVIELRYHEGTGTLTAATFGHGIQRVTLP